MCVNPVPARTIASCVGGGPSGSKDGGGRTPRKSKGGDKEKGRRRSSATVPPAQTRGGHRVYKVVVLGDGGVGKSGESAPPINVKFQALKLI